MIRVKGFTCQRYYENIFEVTNASSLKENFFTFRTVPVNQT